MRFASSGANSPISRKLGTWCSGITSRWTSARGLMSLMATNPSADATWSPSRYSRQKRQSSASDDPLLRHARAADADELPDLGVNEPRRVIVAIASAGPVDEDDVLAADLPPPPLAARRVGGCTEAAAPLLLHRRRNWIAPSGRGAGPRRVREDVPLRHSRLGEHRQRVLERRVRFGREADDDVRREVEVVADRLETAKGRR